MLFSELAIEISASPFSANPIQPTHLDLNPTTRLHSEKRKEGKKCANVFLDISFVDNMHHLGKDSSNHFVTQSEACKHRKDTF